MSEKYYIGLTSCYHDSSLALVNEKGEIVFAEASERYLQNKRALSTPADNYFFVQKVLKKYPMSDYEIGYISKAFTNVFSYLSAHLAIYAIRNYIGLVKWVGRKIRKQDGDTYASALDFQYSPHFALRTNAGTTIRHLLNKKFNLPYKGIANFDHHLCHAYHGYFTAPCTNATILVIDGYGDEYSSYSIYKADKQQITRVFRNKTRISLGDFYGELTLLCGFDAVAGEQWKVMGMAPYGKKCNELYADFEKWIYTEGIELKTRSSQFHIEFRKKIKEKAYGELSREDLAFTGQFFYEEIIKQLTNAIYLKWPSTNLVMAGGCILNSASNGKIHIDSPFKNVFVPSAPADDGCAIGAALLSFHENNPNKNIPYDQQDPYLGFDINEEEILFFAKYSGYAYEKTDYQNLYKTVAQEIQSGKIIAWVQGRAEFGPRALGNRSILANPSLADMKDKINANVKFREEFRPFAPSILEEKANDYFENYHPTPYMERVLNIKENKRAELKAVNHVDNTGRLQTVTKADNEHFYNLINEFFKLTNIPVLLNTSFNVMGKPIVNSVNDMASVFATSGIDVLVINDYIFRKK